MLFQLSEGICALVGQDVRRIDAVEALLAEGAERLENGDAARAKEAFVLACGLPGDTRYDRLQQLYHPDRDFSDLAARRAAIEARIEEIYAAAER